METFWYVVVTLMLAVYVVLDGFDFGVGILYPFAARTELERRTALASIGPVWNGNEVWLIASGGLLFFAFPRAYAAGFSGFYLALILVLWLLIFRGLADRRREKAFPKGFPRPLLTAAEKRPAKSSLIVLRAREGQRQQHDIALVRQLAGMLRQFRRPIRVVHQLAASNAMGRFPGAETR